MGDKGPPGGDAGSELGLQSQVVVGPLIQEWGGGVMPAGGNNTSAARVKLLQREGMFSALFWCLRGSMAVPVPVLNVQCSAEHSAAAPPTCDGSRLLGLGPGSFVTVSQPPLKTCRVSKEPRPVG